MAKKPVNSSEEKVSIEDLLNKAMELAPTQIVRTHIARALAELKFTK